MRGPLLMLLLVALPTTAIPAQYLTRPNIPWRTISTAHFDIHYPAEMQEWTEAVARRIESVATAVNAAVGNQPRARVTVMVEDPSAVSNGFAIPFLGAPVVFLWPTPPTPSPSFGDNRGWGELLAVHEYAHIAHLSYPSRNSGLRLLWKLSPVRFGPIAQAAPAWVTEGYATLIEGELTGSGRPASVGRAAVLRQWSLEGKLPTYSQLNSTGSFLGGSMRYLVGSAFLGWLQERKGDSSLVHLWRRMSARQQRSFDDAFAGVFGASPQDMYGAFTVDLMAKSLEARRILSGSGLVEGTLVQRLTGSTGDPAVSPDGKRIAIVVRSLKGPSRLVVWPVHPPDDSSALARERQRLLKRDPMDVPAIDSFPRPRKAIATLHPAGGRSHENPRWMPDGERLLVSRDEPTADGVYRPDLFLWNSEGGGVKRVTHGAGIRQADPAPDGLQAAGVRCDAGICSLVLVNLRNGSWRVLAGGSPDTVWARPRFSPDGSAIAASVHAGREWQVALVDTRSGAVRILAPDRGVARHSPAWLPSGTELVVVSERGGVANLELLPLDDTSPCAVTRVIGALTAPEVNPADGSVYFLSLRSGGLDLRHLPPGAAQRDVDVVALPARLTPAVPPAGPVAPALPRLPVSAYVPQFREYGLGPRNWRVMPGGQYGPDGSSATLMVANIDPISRMSVVAQGGYGRKGTWRGVSLSLGMRRTAVWVDASGWYADHFPSEQQAGLFAPLTADVRTRGLGAIARYAREGGMAGMVLRGGMTVGTVSGQQLENAGRLMALGEARARLTLGMGRNSVNLVGGVTVNAGNTDGESFTRIVKSAEVTIGTPQRSLRGEWRNGSLGEVGPGEFGRAFEQFLVGGPTPPYFDPAFMSQRISLPSVPSGFVYGPRFEMYRASVRGFTWEPYFVWVAAGDSLNSVKRIAGLENEFVFRSMGWVRMPAVRIRVGAGYSFDAPYQYRTRAYASVIYSP